MPQNFASQIGTVSFNFEAVPDLQPKAIRGIIARQRLPEENVLRNVVVTTPVAEKLFKARLDDQIDLRMTPEVSANADDPMVSDTYRWKSDQVHEYRQAGRINREVGAQLLAPDGSPARFAGQNELARILRTIVTCIDNRREFNRAMSILNAHDFDPSRKADLGVTHYVTIANDAEGDPHKWDNVTKDAQGNQITNPFRDITTVKNRLAFLCGATPNVLITTPDVQTAIENHTDFNREQRPATMPGAAYVIRNLNVFISQGKKNIGDADAPKIVPLFQNLVIIGAVGPGDDTIGEYQYDINRVEQFVTADRLFFYVRYWHKSKVHVSRPNNFAYINNPLNNAYSFENVSSYTIADV